MADISLLDEIIRKSDIVELAKALGMKLGTNKANYTLAICPFHTDTQPSLALFRDPQNPHYHCFACGAHGGIIDLVERKRQSSRNEAINWLAHEVGVELRNRPRGTRAPDAETNFQEFQAWLNTHHDHRLLQRFAEHRHIDLEILRQVGAHAINMNLLVPHELPHNQSEVWEQAGILVRRRGVLASIVSGEQIVFPVNNGFIFRTADIGTGGDKGRRYRFSKGLKKVDILFGSSQAAKQFETGDTNHGLFVVEGIVDVLRLQSLGFAAVGILGTSISNPQADQIRRLCIPNESTVIPIHLFLDADDAGRRAAATALRGLLNTKSPAPIDVIWPDREGDPDELLRGADPSDAIHQLAAWTHSVLAVLIAGFTGFSVNTAFDELTAAKPLRRVETLRYILSQLGGQWTKSEI